MAGYEQDSKTELLGLDIPALEAYSTHMGLPRFRGRQIYKWVYCKDVGSFYEMSDLPRELRQRLDNQAKISIPRVLKQRMSFDGTRKYLIEFDDRKRVETVLIPQGADQRYTICLSTQVGCPVACIFCATGQSGFQRNLSFYEIVGQFLGSRRQLRRKLKTDNEALISNIVFMGMGEPLLNYDAVIKSIGVFNNAQGINIGQRHITISTSGEAQGIEKLARENLQVTLAVSLHACDNALRDRLVPLNKKYPLERLMDAIGFYIAETNRRVTFEYVLLDGTNDRKQDAINMIRLLKPLLANINLIPYNEVDGLPVRRPAKDKIDQFYRYLEDGGLNVTLREEKGSDIEAACGQLKANNNKPMTRVNQ